NLAVPNVLLHVANRVGQLQRLGLRHAQYMIRDALGAFSPNAGQLGKLIDKITNRFGDQVAGSRLNCKNSPHYTHPPASPLILPSWSVNSPKHCPPPQPRKTLSKFAQAARLMHRPSSDRRR